MRRKMEFGVEIEEEAIVSKKRKEKEKWHRTHCLLKTNAIYSTIGIS